jgi:hypothetical protein
MLTYTHEAPTPNSPSPKLKLTRSKGLLACRQPSNATQAGVSNANGHQLSGASDSGVRPPTRAANNSRNQSGQLLNQRKLGSAGETKADDWGEVFEAGDVIV